MKTSVEKGNIDTVNTVLSTVIIRERPGFMRRDSSRKRKKKKSRTGKICISCMVLVLTGILSIQIVRLYHRDEDYLERQEQLAAELAEEEQRAEDLQQQEEYIGSDEYVEEIARTKLGMVYPDEILFKEE